MTTPKGPEASTDALKDRLGGRLLTDPVTLRDFSDDRSLAVPEGAPLGVVLARNAEHVSAALAWANETRTPVSVRGAGSGLSGGAVSYPGGLVISLEAMNQVLDIDVENRLADVEPGVITSKLDEEVRRHGLFFAPDPASVHLSTVGGNIATDAGGLRCIAHGTTAAAVAALEVVLADGSIIHTGARTIKNATGLNMTPLFVGSEGTLGVITRATVRLKPVPEGTPRTFFASFDDIESAGRAVTSIVSTNPRPEVLELIDSICARLIEEFEPSGLPQPEAALLLGQTEGPTAQRDAEILAATCERLGATRTHVQEGNDLLEARRLANGALMAGKYAVHCDVGVPVGQLVEMIRGVEAIAEESGRGVSILAHAGDGNLHPAVESDETPEDRARAEEVVDRITELAISLGGVITGEHGVGSIKHRELPLQFDEPTLRAQRALKAALDPNGILTPGRGI
ncbi:FAD-binding oxidoreductase [Rothia uropygioeca]|uniref:FAD-binding oxidoreductase n=1 Tax=Kocuria sp. 257 TaxID=2021970 RepID=UPI001010DE95|nr:FAD-linked oxidase C-terminal domain-containing protein [Kocuria sp. 257]